MSLWGVLPGVSFVSLQYPKIVNLPQAVKSLLFPNQKRTQNFLKRDPILTIKWGPKGDLNNMKKRPKMLWFIELLDYIELLDFIGLYRIKSDYRIISDFRIISDYQILLNKLIFTWFFTLSSIYRMNFFWLGVLVNFQPESIWYFVLLLTIWQKRKTLIF